MLARTLLLAASMTLGASLAAAQAAPNWRFIPTTCASQCGDVARSASLCETQFSGDFTNIYGCYCNSLPSNSASCASCLTSNNAGALARLVTSAITECPAAQRACYFQCSIVPCDSTDVACQCSAGYLQDIHDCGQCNTANGNTAATQLSDWESLRNSCREQNYTGAAGVFATRPAPSPTGVAQYTPVVLTATGGGAAATGDAEDLAQTGPAATTRRAAATAAGSGGSATPAVSGSAARSGASGVAASGPARAAGSVSSGTPTQPGASGSGANANAPSAASDQVIVRISKAAANNLVVPVTGLMAVLGSVLAML